MKFIITESQLKTLFEQSNKPIRVSVYDDNDKRLTIIQKYCPQHKIPKELILSKVPALKNGLMTRLNNQINKNIKNVAGSSIVENIIADCLKNTGSILQNIVVNAFYATTGYIEKYDMSNDAILLANKIYENLNSKFTLVYKLVVKTYVNKDNVDGIKKMIDQELSRNIMVLKKIINESIIEQKSKVFNEFKKTIPVCKEVIFFDPYSKEERYASVRLKTGDLQFFSNKDVLKHINNKLMPLINSFV